MYTVSGEAYWLEGDWWEYNVTLWENGKFITGWDSMYETYDGLHKLTKAEAIVAIVEIIEDVKNGKASDWFTF